MTRILVVLLLALLVEALGVVLLSRGLKQLGPVQKVNVEELTRVICGGVGNGNILAGIVLEALFFGALLYLLSQKDVSLVWPLTSLGFVITALAAKFLLGEQVSWLRWTGVALIVVGAALVSLSEAYKDLASKDGRIEVETAAFPTPE